MHLKHTARTIVIAVALGGAGVAAHAEGDIYSRLMTMRALEATKDGMITKEKFLEMVSRMWDMKAQEMKSKDGMLSPAQLKELQKLLGRNIGA
jgi:hypothetical protein